MVYEKQYHNTNETAPGLSHPDSSWTTEVNQHWAGSDLTSVLILLNYSGICFSAGSFLL